jgi:F0F1-type ATP synthase assembly protein I
MLKHHTKGHVHGAMVLRDLLGENTEPDRASIGRWVKVGSMFLGDVVGMTLVGYFADRSFDISPWGTAIGCLVGMCLGMYHLIRSIK